MSNTISGVSATTQQYTDYSSVSGKQAENQLIKILQEAEEFDADKEAWISLEELKEVVGVTL